MASRSVACDSLLKCTIAVAKNRKFRTALGISVARARASGFPPSTLSARASFSRSRSRRSATRSRTFDRSSTGVPAHPGNADRAAATARSTSRSSLSGKREYTLPVAGSTLSRYRPPTGSTGAPPAKLRIVSMAAGRIALREPRGRTRSARSRLLYSKLRAQGGLMSDDPKMRQWAEQIQKDIRDNLIFVYAKGEKSMAMCGFSHRVMEIFDRLGVDYEVCNVLADRK